MRQLGDIAEGRPNLGESMPVEVYRLFEMSIMDILTKEYGQETANDLFRKTGFQAGAVFANKYLSKEGDFNSFVSNLQKILSDCKIGILRIEKADLEKGEMVLTVYEDLDCSGLPVTDEQVCVYDEGFIAGILHYFTGIVFTVREIDCWASGDRVCRFEVKK